MASARTRVNLGDEVKDPITGFKGVAVCRLQYLNGCDRIAVQPKLNKDGTIPVDSHFDEPQLEITKRKFIEESVVKDTGGPDKFSGDGGNSMHSRK